MRPAELEALLRAELSGQKDSAGRGIWTADHCVRTAHLAVALRKETGALPQMDSLLYLAGLFHDVAHDSAPHAIHGPVGAARTHQLLSGRVDTALLQEAEEIIAVHDDRRPGDGRSAALHLVQDADMLDHFGTVRVWSIFGYSAKHERCLAASLDRMELAQAKLPQYLTLLHSEAARREMCRRLQTEASFAACARAQSRGELGAQLLSSDSFDG